MLDRAAKARCTNSSIPLEFSQLFIHLRQAANVLDSTLAIANRTVTFAMFTLFTAPSQSHPVDGFYSIISDSHK